MQVIFFLSGFAALLYQISWQRMLFTSFGVDMEAITMIVAVFMLGLGVGGYCGGRIADRFPRHLLLIFTFIELGIGAFGLISADAIGLSQRYFAHYNVFVVGIVTFMLLIFPTFLMGATLPLLTTFLNQHHPNTGKNIGGLYFTNTLGAMSACFCTAFFLFSYFTLLEAINFAAGLNFMVAAIVFTLHYQARKPLVSTISQPDVEGNKSDEHKSTHTRAAIQLSFFSGLLSLALEIVLIRLFGFAFFSTPFAFAIVLAMFLAGLALGASIGKRRCAENKASLLTVGHYFFYAAVADVMAILLFQFYFNPLLLLVVVFIVAAIRGTVFPMVHHLGTVQQKTGKAISNVYFANVLGATIAPIVVGFVLLDLLSTQQVYLLIVLLTFVVAIFFSQKWIKWTAVAGTVLALVAVFALPERIMNNIVDKSSNNLELKELFENRSGIIQVYQDKENNELVFGNNVYDGAFNTSLSNNINGIHRAYLLPVIAPQAKEILVIGLSTGSWISVLTQQPSLEKITVIELNPSYVEFARRHPEMQKILQDKRIEIIVDDGRRYLNQHPELKYDYILMNTSWHWRAYQTALLSQEYFQLTKQHLRPNGFVYLNTTSSMDVWFTVSQQFPYSYRYANMALGSLSPMSFNQLRIEDGLMALSEKGKPLFNAQTLPNAVQEIQKVQQDLIPLNNDYFSVQHPQRSPEIITDWNMITEYKYGLFNQDVKSTHSK